LRRRSPPPASAVRRYATSVWSSLGGIAGIGIADQICDAMVLEGFSKQGRAGACMVCGPEGITDYRHGQSPARMKVIYAHPAGESKGWKRDGNDNGVSLAEVVRR